MKPAVHRGKVYFSGGISQDKAVYCCDVKSLIDCCGHHSDKSDHLWKFFDEMPLRYSSLVSYGQQLISIGGHDGIESKIHVYSPHKCAWLHIGNSPLELHSVASVVLPNQSLIVIGGNSHQDGYKISRRVYKAFKGNVGLS